MALTVLVPGLAVGSDKVTAQIIGRSRATVVRMRKKFREICSMGEPKARNWGGRRYGYMTVEQEREFLSGFLDKAAEGGILIVREIKSAFEAQAGKKVAKTTIYRMLERHGWRKIMPRPRHPKGDDEAREGFKKTPKDGG
jgi:transposase